MEYGVQIASLTVIIIAGLNYFRDKKPKILSFSMFQILYFTVLANTIFDFLSLYGVKNIDTVGETTTIVFHVLFALTLTLAFYMYMVYCYIRGKRSMAHQKKNVLLGALPPAAAAVACIFTPVEFHHGEDGSYATGPLISLLYVFLIASLVLTTITILRFRKNYTPSEFYTLIFGVPFLLAFGLWEFFVPSMLLSPVALSVLIMVMYIAVENPRELYHYTVTNTLNSNTMRMVMDGYFANKQTFYIGLMFFSNRKHIQNSLRYEELTHLMNQIAEVVASVTGKMVYYLENMELAILIDNYDDYQKVYHQRGRITDKIKKITGRNNLQLFYSALECPKYAESSGKVMEFIPYIRREGAGRLENGDFFNVDDKEYNNERFTRAVESLLSDAVANDGFSVYYQPILDVKTGRFRYAEALIRLKDTKTLGFVSPELFIPIAERSGLINDIGAIVLNKVCTFLKRPDIGEVDLAVVDVNVSALQAVEEDFPNWALSVIRGYGLDPECITFELTETASVEMGSLLDDNFKLLKSAGCVISMDDFGTGYSNISKMADTQFQIAKLDKSIVWAAFPEFSHTSEAESEKAKIVLESCISMMKNLGLTMVAEGVETKEMVEYLKSQGVDQLQGYFYSKPLPEEDFIAFLRENKRKVVSLEDFAIRFPHKK